MRKRLFGLRVMMLGILVLCLGSGGLYAQGVNHPSSDELPFGAFDTPLDGANVCSSFAVTGWALDDSGIVKVKIYRQQGNDLIFIDNAVQVEGARPDVAQAFPNYPNNTKAGWGYMLLSHFLPNGGNGTFILHAVAVDSLGQEKSLGVKTIYCDNLNAVKPFGAIDTPVQGEVISGSRYRVQGWVLTPMPNRIPEDGSTIRVRIDGTDIGHANYNEYRSDIAALFLGYANSDAAMAYLDFDTTNFSNGVHILDWLVTDSAGNIDGIGSRFITIDNSDMEMVPVEFSPGTDTIVSSRTVGPYGDTFEVTDIHSPLHGVKIDIPAGALNRDVTVTLASNSGTVTPNSGTFSGKVISLKAPNVSRFDQPVTVTVPYSGEPGVPVPYLVSDSGALLPARIITLQQMQHVFKFHIFTASKMTWFWEDGLSGEDVVDTGFRSNKDGFRIANRGSTVNDTGECLGMTSFALWYHANKKESMGDFYGKYFSTVEGSLTGEDIIATRAYISIAQQWHTYLPNMTYQEGLTDKVRYQIISNSLTNTGPSLIYLGEHETLPKAAHSVLAIGVNNATNTIAIYDPNYPGTTKTIRYKSDTESFEPYDSFRAIVFNGDENIAMTESYQNILDDAEAKFQGSGKATIYINSHTDGQEVTNRNVQFTGVIESGEVLVEKLTILVGGSEFKVNVGPDGVFDVALSLESGVNKLYFKTEGNDRWGNLIGIGNNLENQDAFTLNLNVPYSMILMTLTWDTNNTDLDTYVIDPGGDYSCYYHKETADGGELDYDIVDGYGPEHWTLMSSDTVRYGSPYRFRVHYYNDSGFGPSNYNLSIKLYEGTNREVTYTYRGNLSVSNASNIEPDATGADWADVAAITLTQGSGDPRMERTPTGTIILTVPVPNRDQCKYEKQTQGISK